MRNYIVIVAPTDQEDRNNEGMGYGAMYEGMRGWGLCHANPWEKGELASDSTAFRTTERDVEALVKQVTKDNAGKEVHVFKLVSVAIRPAGDIVTKEVTKDGILPKSA